MFLWASLTVEASKDFAVNRYEYWLLGCNQSIAIQLVHSQSISDDDL